MVLTPSPFGRGWGEESNFPHASRAHPRSLLHREREAITIYSVARAGQPYMLRPACANQIVPVRRRVPVCPARRSLAVAHESRIAGTQPDLNRARREMITSSLLHSGAAWYS